MNVQVNWLIINSDLKPAHTSQVHQLGKIVIHLWNQIRNRWARTHQLTSRNREIFILQATSHDVFISMVDNWRDAPRRSTDDYLINEDPHVHFWFCTLLHSRVLAGPRWEVLDIVEQVFVCQRFQIQCSIRNTWLLTQVPSMTPKNKERQRKKKAWDYYPRKLPPLHASLVVRRYGSSRGEVHRAPDPRDSYM